ncbi:MAG: hypothetical protein OXP66_02525 [Candidatus Tectomicrobia bacterium]|nr:hypothetical protein [Candidatus Tectomicrobia bacterium]
MRFNEQVLATIRANKPILFGFAIVVTVGEVLYWSLEVGPDTLGQIIVYTALLVFGWYLGYRHVNVEKSPGYLVDDAVSTSWRIAILTLVVTECGRLISIRDTILWDMLPLWGLQYFLAFSPTFLAASLIRRTKNRRAERPSTSDLISGNTGLRQGTRSERFWIMVVALSQVAFLVYSVVKDLRT